MRNRRYVANHTHFQTRSCERSDRRLSSRSGTTHANVHGSHAMIARLVGGVHRRLLGRKRSPFSRTAKSASARRRLRHQISLRIRDRDQRIVKRRRDMHDPLRNILFLFLLESLLFCWCFCHKISLECRVESGELHEVVPTLHSQLATLHYFLPGAFFFATAALRGPFLVRAFVCVRCPRTGRPRLWRSPR